MKISIIIPAYNVEKYINKCLDSILKQSYKNIEIIVVDDGSTDATYKILKQYGKKIKLIHQKNQGVSCSRNNALKVATGEYIMFVDGDDWIDSSMIQKMCLEIENENIDIVRCGFIREHNDYKNIFPLTNEKITITEDKSIIWDRFINTYDLSSPCCQLIKKSCIKKLFNENIKVGEDYLFNLDVYSNANNFVFLPDCYYHYLYNDNSATTVIDYEKIYKRCEDSIIVYSHLFEYIKKWKYNSKKNIQLVNYRILKELNMKLISLFKNNDKLKQEKKKIIFEFFNNNNVKKIRKNLKLKTIIKNVNIYSMFIICIKYNLYNMYYLLANLIYISVYKLKNK